VPYVKLVDQFVSEERDRSYLLAADFGGLSGAFADGMAAGLSTGADENPCQAIEAPAYVTVLAAAAGRSRSAGLVIP
jgi:hypothetical protein